MALNRHQRGIAAILLDEAHAFGASPREEKALLEAGIVESGLRNLSGGDRDSAGVLQQRPSQGWGSYGQVTNPRYAARKFLRKARQINRRGFHGSAGQLAQAVQRSAFPHRYDQHSGQAEALLGSQGGRRAPGSTMVGRDGGSTGAQATTQLSPGGTGLADLLAAQMDRPQVQVSAPTPPSFTRSPVMPKGYQQVESGGPPSPKGASLDDLLSAAGSLQGPDLPQGAQNGSAGTRGHSGAGYRVANSSGTRRYHGPLFELFWQGPGGINIKNGQREPMGFVDGHKDHVHVAAGPKMVVRLGKLAEKMGLHVGENPHFGGVSHGSHVRNSYHYRDRAIDVTGTPQQMARYAHTVAQLMLR